MRSAGPDRAAEAAGFVHDDHAVEGVDAQEEVAAGGGAAFRDVDPGQAQDAVGVEAAGGDVGPGGLHGGAFAVPPDVVAELAEVVGAAVVAVPGAGEVGGLGRGRGWG